MLRGIIVGDSHGYFAELVEFIKELERDFAPIDFIIQCGDFGFWYDTIQAKKKSLNWLFNNYQVYFVRGNHEEYKRFGKPYFLDFEHAILDVEFPTVKYRPIQLGDIKLDDVTIQGIGGADSVDKDWRLNEERYAEVGIQYWWEEEAVDLSKAKKETFDIIISHDIPDNVSHFVPYMDKDKYGNESLTNYYCKYPPTFWFAGHHHQYCNFKDNRSGTEFFIMPESNNGFAVLDINGKTIKCEAYNLW